MTLPAGLLSALIWLSLAGVTAGAVYLVVTLVREWRRDELW